ncbi:MAG: hypothetical protein M0P33_00055 [Massilibacteroides sp.]|nr:hypothetical protein [Massilibacteroides sp.]
MAITIPYNFEPRPYQRSLFQALDDGYKRLVAVWHRRAGKDKSLMNLLVREMFKRRGTYFYLFPTYSQGRKIIWDGMDRTGFPFLNHIPSQFIESKNSTELKVSLVNGSIFQIVGTDNIDTIVGTNPIGCVFSEYSIQDPRGWEFIRPILRENGGWAAFNYTPRGHNHGWKLYQMALANKNWWAEKLTVDDTKVLSKADIDEERSSGMDEAMIEQEFYCSFEAAIQGAYYAQQMTKVRKDKRICSVPIQRGVAVDTWWDLGMDDSTAIWFTQDCGRELHIVDYYECSGEGLPHYAKILQEKNYLYGKHMAPHDIRVRELGTGKSRLEQADALGVRFLVAPKLRVEDGIEAVRNLLDICWFDEQSTTRGVEALDQYRKSYDERNKIFRSTPLHDWTSHAADAFRVLATAHNFGSRHRAIPKRNARRMNAAGWTS